VNLNVDVESFRVACAPVIEKNPDLFLPELEDRANYACMNEGARITALLESR
jgi:hypothetical protein